jgi:hypothetical protein
MKTLVFCAAILLFILSIGCAASNQFDSFVILWCSSLILVALAYIIHLLEK